MQLVEKSVSGGQTGADRAALLWASDNHIPHGGWCPRGRRAEDGELSPIFHLEETPSSGYAQRTEWNIRDSDATVIFSLSRSLAGGSLLTWDLAGKWKRPCIRISKNGTQEPAKNLNDFLEQEFVRTLNIAGRKEESEPGIADCVTEVLS